MSTDPHIPGWKAQPERSSAFWLGLLVWIATHLGRGITRLLLWPITLFFLATGSAARRASRDYLARVLGRPPRLGEVLTHFHTFATCVVDRLLLLCGRARRLKVRTELPQEVLQAARSGKGCIMLVSHVGSFEVLRQLGGGDHAIPLRIVLDRGHGALLTGLLERLNPAFAASIIDAGQRGPELVLALREALDQGYSVGIMADRVLGREPALAVDLLGGSARLPAGPWVLASVLRVPVIAAFGIYRGGGDYDAHFELLTPGMTATRAERPAAMQALAQRYAAQLELRLREAPYNWFNFYSYWPDGPGLMSGGSDERAAG
jgi:predicted LPLAT superfamily acyltransferase